MIRSDSEFLQCALKCYDNPTVSTISEFETDVKKFGVLNMLMTRYKNDIGKRERLILNYIVILQNCFGPSVVDMLYYKIDDENIGQLETYLYFLDLLEQTTNSIDFELLNSLEQL